MTSEHVVDPLHSPACMTDALKARDGKDVEDAVRWALAEGKTLEVVGRGTKRALGRPSQSDLTLDLSGLTGVTLYEPEELVLSAKAGTPLAEIEALVRDKGQQLAFEPMDYGPILGGAGRRRLARRRARGQSVGPAADQGRRRARPFPRLLGGVRPRRDLQVRRPRGEERHRLRSLQAAGRLVRHARGDDRGDHQDAAAAGDRGDRAGARPRRRRAPTQAMAAAMASSCDVSGAAHLPAGVGRCTSTASHVAQAATAFRLEGVAPSVSHRKDGAGGAAAAVRAGRSTSTTAHSRALWRSVRDASRSRPSGRPASGRCGGSRPRRRAAREFAGDDRARRAVVLRLGRRPDLDRAAAVRRRRRRLDPPRGGGARRSRHADPRAGRAARRGRCVRAAARRARRA